MFGGIVRAVGHVVEWRRGNGIDRLRIDTGEMELGAFAPGDSLAVNGVCLTAVAVAGEDIAVEISAETRSRTTLAELRPGDRVNLEPAVSLTTLLGGHLVSGHVDGPGEILSRRAQEGCERFTVRAPHALTPYLCERGSVCVDGVSLTVVGVTGAEFVLNVVPYTLNHTTLGDRRPGHRVNLEADVVARYLQRLIQFASSGPGSDGTGG